MKYRPTSPRVARLKKEVSHAKRRKAKQADSGSSRYLLAVAGAALLAGIIFISSPSDPPTTMSVAEQTSP